MKNELRKKVFLVQIKILKTSNQETGRTAWGVIKPRRCLEKSPLTSISPCIKDKLKAFNGFKNKQCSVRNSVFWYVKVCIFWKYLIFNTLCIEIKHKFKKKIPSDKINGTKNALILLLQASAHHSFTFNLWFLYELKHKVRLSKAVCEIFHFRFRFVFIKIYSFFRQNAWTLWL